MVKPQEWLNKNDQKFENKRLAEYLLGKMWKMFGQIFTGKKIFANPPVSTTKAELSHHITKGESSPRPRAAEAMQKPSFWDKFKYNFKTLLERSVGFYSTGIQVETKGLKALTAVKVDPVAAFNDLNDAAIDLGMQSLLTRLHRSQDKVIPLEQKKILEKLEFNKLTNAQILRLRSNLDTLKKEGFPTAVESLIGSTQDEEVRKILRYNLDLFEAFEAGISSRMKEAVTRYTVEGSGFQILKTNLEEALNNNPVKPLLVRRTANTKEFLSSLDFSPNTEQRKTVPKKIFNATVQISEQFFKDAHRGSYQLQFPDGSITELDFKKGKEEENYKKMLLFFGYDKKKPSDDKGNENALKRLTEFTIWANQGSDDIGGDIFGLTGPLVAKARQKQNKEFVEWFVKHTQEKFMNKLLENVDVENIPDFEKFKKTMEKDVENVIKNILYEAKKNNYSKGPFEVCESLKNRIVSDVTNLIDPLLVGPDTYTTVMNHINTFFTLSEVNQKFQSEQGGVQQQPERVELSSEQIERLQKSPFFEKLEINNQIENFLFQIPAYSLNPDASKTILKKIFTKDQDGNFHLVVIHDAKPGELTLSSLNWPTQGAMPTKKMSDRLQQRHELHFDYDPATNKLKFNLNESSLELQVFGSPITADDLGVPAK